MVVSPLWSGPDVKSLPTRIGHSSNTNSNRLFLCEDNNVAFTHVQPLYYHVRQEEPRHKLGGSRQALILSTLAIGAMP